MDQKPAPLSKLPIREKQEAVDKVTHLLRYANIKQEGWPGFAFFVQHGGDIHNLSKPWRNSYAEKTARDIHYNKDTDEHHYYKGMGFHDGLKNLFVDGQLKLNTGGYPVKLFLLFLDKILTDEEAYETALEFATLINKKSNNSPHLVVPKEPSPFHPTENLTWQDLLQNEQCLEIISNFVGNPCSIPNFGMTHASFLAAFIKPASLCPTMAAIFQLGNEWVHPSFLSADENELIQQAYQDPSPDDNLYGEDQHHENQADNMDEDSFAEQDGDTDNNQDDDDFGEQDSFIVQDGDDDDDDDGSYDGN
jgi:hypothetical protein